MIREAASYLGRALAGFVTVLNVDRILIGGPIPPQAYPLIIPPIMEVLDQLTITPVATAYVLELGALRGDAVLDGTVWLALERARVDYLLRYATTATTAHAKSTGPRRNDSARLKTGPAPTSKIVDSRSATP